MARRAVFRPDKKVHAWALAGIVILWGIAALSVAFEGPVQRTAVFGLGGLVAAIALLYRDRIVFESENARLVRSVGLPWLAKTEIIPAQEIAAVGLARVGEGRHASVQLDVRLSPDYRQVLLEEAPISRADLLEERAHDLASQLRAGVEVDDGFEASVRDAERMRARARRIRRLTLWVMVPLTFVLAMVNPYFAAVREGADLPFWQAVLDLSRPRWRRPAPATYIEAASVIGAGVFLLISINAFLRLRADARRKPRAATDEDAARADTAIVQAG